MAKETLAEKLAKKTFNSENLQKSWAIHMQAFGPILEPAFSDNYQARVHLTAALNRISKRDIRGGLDKLQEVQKHVESDADKAAWLFFMGVCFEMAGAKEQMISYYQQAAEFGHRFYLPYLKVAKSAHNDAVFEVAEANYHAAIQCFEGTPLNDQSKVILASAYSNLASCLTMMHRYEDAEEALNASIQTLHRQPGRSATAAILYAAMGDKENAEHYLSETEAQMPAMSEQTRKFVDEIFSGKHPHFFALETDAEAAQIFWDWFVDHQEIMMDQLDNQKYDEVFSVLQSVLKPVFPFLQREPDLGILTDEDGYHITFADFYMVSLEHGYRELIESRPEEVSDGWTFDIAH